MFYNNIFFVWFFACFCMMLLSFQTKSTITCTEPTTATLEERCCYYRCCCFESKQVIIDLVRAFKKLPLKKATRNIQRMICSVFTH